ncbi:Uncharacterised protein [Candidatus Anstonella stagnisolia]|nr:Uncharacterised protein [Candidatus Anstonella stagnisolia]
MMVSPTQPEPYLGLKAITVDLAQFSAARTKAAALRNKADALLRKADEVVTHKSGSWQSKEVSFSTEADKVLSYMVGSGQSKILMSHTSEGCINVVREKYD